MKLAKSFKAPNFPIPQKQDLELKKTTQLSFSFLFSPYPSTDTKGNPLLSCFSFDLIN